jgi:cytochrome c
MTGEFRNHGRMTKSIRPTQFRYPVSVRPYVSLLFAMAVLLFFSTAEICAQTAGTGKADYQNYCAGCHGTDGTGAKDVDIPGPDLTHLSKKNGGSFPFQEVYDVIDGRKLAAAHKRLLSMPLWGYISSRKVFPKVPRRRKLNPELLLSCVTSKAFNQLEPPHRRERSSNT